MTKEIPETEIAAKAAAEFIYQSHPTLGFIVMVIDPAPGGTTGYCANMEIDDCAVIMDNWRINVLNKHRAQEDLVSALRRAGLQVITDEDIANGQVKLGDILDRIFKEYPNEEQQN